MRTKLFLLAMVINVTLFASCKKSGVATLNIQVNPFTITQTDISNEKSSAVGTVTRIDIAIFDAVGNVAYSVNQSSADSSNFGNLSCTLHDGTYTLVVIGHKSSGPAIITGPGLATFPNNVMGEIFCATRSITIASSTTQNVSILLNRVISMFGVRSTDAIPHNVASMIITLSSGGTSLNPTTGLATSATQYTHKITIPISYLGYVNAKFYAPTLLVTDEALTNATVSAVDSTDAILYTRSFSNISLKRNRITLAVGPFFSADNEGTFTFNTAWIDTTYINWQ